MIPSVFHSKLLSQIQQSLCHVTITAQTEKTKDRRSRFCILLLRAKKSPAYEMTSLFNSSKPLFFLKSPIFFLPTHFRIYPSFPTIFIALMFHREYITISFRYALDWRPFYCIFFWPNSDWLLIRHKGNPFKWMEFGIFYLISNVLFCNLEIGILLTFYLWNCLFTKTLIGFPFDC